MTVSEALEKLGGVARWIELRELVSQRALERAVRDKSVARVGRGVYRLPNRPVSTDVPGVYSHVTAAELWDFGVLRTSRLTHVTVPRSASRISKPADTKLHYADLPAHAIHRNVTSPLQTVIDCARTCPFDEALAIADTAVRLRHFARRELDAAVARLHGPGSRQARRVATECDPRSHSPLESALRALLLDAGLTFFVPQYVARHDGRKLAQVDLGDPTTGVLLEADSFWWHGQRGSLERDAQRYDELVSHDYLVLRFAYEQILGKQQWVLGTVRRTLALRS